ncbi:AAA family ATPase [Actinosynnema sp. NPDC053489]|uniref:AAA family ATPase n=1 Tax=Actinosynnema sp. NPDC053489 TaxID=3363916 RepID=UPI0037C6F805
MRLGISGTYSSGKTLTAMAVAHYTGLPRTRARTMREILPDAAPGKTLEECTAAELIQMIVIRHVERVVHETNLASGFVSDGSSLQEWIYGSIRVVVGINPNASAHLRAGDQVERTEELRFFEDVMAELGRAMKRHVKGSFDAFVHLRNELPLAADGHRPVNDLFRTMADEELVRTLDELGIPHHEVGGAIEQRLERIADLHDLVPVMPVERAVELARAEYAGLDTRDEARRAADLAGNPA